jgi:hypothetical protein
MSAENQEYLQYAREELRRQFISFASVLAQGFDRSRNGADLEQIIKLRAAIDALDHAIGSGWSQPSIGAESAQEPTWDYTPPASSSRDDDLDKPPPSINTL